jgi:hypothetical protein
MTRKPESKFTGILSHAKGREPEPKREPQPPAIESPPPSPAPVETPAPKKRGRPAGKRSDPGYVQVTAYIPSELHHNIKLALLQERKGREFSELVGELLAAWLESRR